MNRPDLNSPRPAAARGSAAKLFDLRVLIALVLGVYGAILLLVGLHDGASSLAKADGVPINLWMGIGLLVTALLFGLWRWFDRQGGRPQG